MCSDFDEEMIRIQRQELKKKFGEFCVALFIFIILIMIYVL